jgi:hypothetical protein
MHLTVRHKRYMESDGCVTAANGKMVKLHVLYLLIACNNKTHSLQDMMKNLMCNNKKNSLRDALLKHPN